MELNTDIIRLLFDVIIQQLYSAEYANTILINAERNDLHVIVTQTGTIQYTRSEITEIIIEKLTSIANCCKQINTQRRKSIQYCKILRLISSVFATITSLEISKMFKVDYGVEQHSQLLLLNTRLTSLEHKKTYCYQSVVYQTITLFDGRSPNATLSFQRSSLMHRLIMSDCVFWRKIHRLFIRQQCILYDKQIPNWCTLDYNYANIVTDTVCEIHIIVTGFPYNSRMII